MDFVESGVGNKDKVLKDLCIRFGIELENVLYIGDDINDIPAIEVAGTSACSADAMESVKTKVDYIAAKNGGDGAIRDIIEHFGIMGYACNQTIRANW